MYFSLLHCILVILCPQLVNVLNINNKDFFFY